MSADLNVKFSQQFTSPIWEVKATENYLLVNTRDEEELSSDFALIDLKQPQLIWEGLAFEDAWWVSAYHLTDEQIVFQKFEDSQNIEDRSVFGFDLSTQEIPWSLEKVLLVGADGNQIQIRNEEDSTLIFDMREQAWVESHEDIEPLDIEYPYHYEAEMGHFETLAKFLKMKAQIDLEGSCDYLEYGNKILISANHVIAGRKALSLYIFDLAGQLLYKELLDEQASGLISGSFFIVKGAVIFVSRKKELKILELNEKV